MDGIPGIGDGIKKKIAEVLKGQSMSKLDELKSDPKMMVLDTLAQVWGVGPVAAKTLYASGIRTIA
jgi:DNA polymerase/3'-5' exonuclease PolX